MAYINKNVSTMAMPSGMNRMGQFPLDMSSVYYDLESLQAYATSGAVAYVGQILSLVDETNNNVTLYAIKNTAGDLVEIAADIVMPEVPEYSGDGAINVADHKISVAVDNETIKIVDGKLTAIIPEIEIPEYVDTNTTYSFAFDKTTQKLTVTPSEGQAIELDLSDFLIASDLPEDKNTEYHLEYNSDDKAIKLVAGADANKMSIDATPFIKDGMLSDVEYDAASNTLTFVWNTDSGLQADTVVLSDILDPYTAGDKIVIDGSKISHAKQTVSAGETGERTYVTNITYDDYGHITGFTTGKETVVDTNDNDTYSAGNGIVVSDADENDNHTVSVKIAANEERLSFAADGGLQVDVSGINTDTNDTYVSGDGIDIRDEGDLLHSVHIKLADGETHLSVDENGLAINLEDHVTKEQAGMNNTEKPGIRFINQEEINKLSALSLDGEDVTISGSVEAAQVKGLYAVIKNIVTNTPSTEDFDSEAEGIQQALGIEAGAQKNVINTTSDDFQVVEGKLLLTKEYVTTNVYQTEVGDLSQLIRTKGDNSTLVEEINAINERLTWMEIGSAE